MRTSWRLILTGREQEGLDLLHRQFSRHYRPQSGEGLGEFEQWCAALLFTGRLAAAEQACSDINRTDRHALDTIYHQLGVARWLQANYVGALEAWRESQMCMGSTGLRGVYGALLVGFAGTCLQRVELINEADAVIAKLRRAPGYSGWPCSFADRFVQVATRDQAWDQLEKDREYLADDRDRQMQIKELERHQLAFWDAVAVWRSGDVPTFGAGLQAFEPLSSHYTRLKRDTLVDLLRHPEYYLGRWLLFSVEGQEMLGRPPRRSFQVLLDRAEQAENEPASELLLGTPRLLCSDAAIVPTAEQLSQFLNAVVETLRFEFPTYITLLPMRRVNRVVSPFDGQIIEAQSLKTRKYHDLSKAISAVQNQQLFQLEATNALAGSERASEGGKLAIRLVKVVFQSPSTSATELRLENGETVWGQLGAWHSQLEVHLQFDVATQINASGAVPRGANTCAVADIASLQGLAQEAFRASFWLDVLTE